MSSEASCLDGRLSIFGQCQTNGCADEGANVYTQEVKSIGYAISSAKADFLYHSLTTSLIRIGICLMATLGSVALKYWTSYWIIVFLIVIPFSLQQFGHLLTVLFEFFYTRYSYARESKQR